MSIRVDIKYIRGVGPKRAEKLYKLGIYTLKDLLFYFPRIYKDYRDNKESGDLIENVETYFGTVIDYFEVYTTSSLRIFKIVILFDDGRKIEANIFKKSKINFDVFATIKKKIERGKKIFVVGKTGSVLFPDKIDVEEIYFPEDDDFSIVYNKIVPVYSLTSGIELRQFRKIVYESLFIKDKVIDEIIPHKFIAKRNLLNRSLAFELIHFPKSLEELKKARERFIYEEFFLMAVAWAIKKRQILEVKKNHTYKINRTLLTPFKNNLGFEFTASQKKAINEIFSDMMSPHPMNRLLQGDVGSGKTVVALSSCLLACENGYQSCFMAPTEILAEQHYYTFKKFLKDLDVKFELLTSSTPSKKKKDIIKKVENGEIDILVGTHSLIDGNIKFKNLTLAVIDEQHRFGVRQRATLRQKGEKIDMLVMTATPIPRTLFLALYGDLDLSVLREMPPQRKGIFTYHVKEEEAFRKAKELLKEGESVYIVFPMIEENEKSTVKSLIKEFERIRREFLPYQCAFLHGKMKALEKQKIMKDFYDRKIQILCATSVIEVGIDVPHANVMIIENAERFGLASLHQLRGRIGRGTREGYCFLVSDVKSGDAYERISAMCSTTNGFELSEKDAYIRGIGEIIGTKQHGDIEFKIASVYLHKDILLKVFEDRDELIKEDPYLVKIEHQALKKEIFEVYGEKWISVDLN
ncbi:MAG: ATP-dependent DNA helicase RecG [Elusimicrobiales bacterium]|nr:ATP-dependent DNA helicase RecG [Elusimicrobiales bacterium]